MPATRTSGSSRSRVGPVHLLAGQFQHRPEEADLRLADLELRGMHAHGQAAGPGRDVVAAQGPLATFVEPPPGVQGQGMGRDDDAAGEHALDGSGRWA